MQEITLQDLYSCTREGHMFVAESALDGAFVSVNDEGTVSGLACNCVCPGCGRPVVARKGEIRIHHFAHHAEADDSGCRSPGETALHKHAKALLERHLKLALPPVIVEDDLGVLKVVGETVIEFEYASLEKRTDDVVPDVICRVGGRNLHVEFVVTHPCDPEKIEKLRSLDAGVIEIDLSGFRSDPLRSLDEAILFKAPRKWLHNRLFSRGEELLSLRQQEHERKQDDQAERLAAIYDGLPAGETLRKGPWARKAEAYGLGRTVSGGGTRPSFFKVHDEEWKAFILFEFAYRRQSRFTPEMAFNAICRRGWVHKAFAYLKKDMIGRIRLKRPGFQSPHDACSRFLKECGESGLIVWTDRGCWGTRLLDETVEAAVAQAFLPDTRREQLHDLVTGLLGAVPSEKSRFDFDRWLARAAADKGLAVSQFLIVGDDAWQDFIVGLETLERALAGWGNPGCETYGLPVASELSRRAEIERQRAEERKEELRRMEERKAHDRGDSLLRWAVSEFGSEGEAWACLPHEEFGGISPMRAAIESADGQRQARAALQARIDERKRETEKGIKRDAAVLGLRNAVSKAYPRKDHAELWMRQTFRQIGNSRPIDHCVDDATLAECLALLPEAGRR